MGTLPAVFPGSGTNSREQLGETAVTHDRARILAIGDDPILLYSRRLVLERDGYLITALRSEAIIEDAQLGGFDLVLLCHSIPDNAANRILEVLSRLAPQTPVVLVSRLDMPACEGPHHIVVPPNPAAMLRAVAQQLSIHRIPANIRTES